MPTIPKDREVYFLCIGTDRSTGDSLGPMVGTLLKKLGVPNVLGSIDDPVHAMNLEERAAEIPSSAFIVAVDASLGASTSIGQIRYSDKGLKPGAGVNKELGTYGDIGVTGIVNVGGFMEYFVLQNTRLSLVMRMAEAIADQLVDALTGNGHLMEDRNVSYGAA
jgi:putative sporulation protein YyaC